MIPERKYWTQSLSFGMSMEDRALQWLKANFKDVLAGIKRIKYNPKDNSRNRLYGDIVMLTKDNHQCNFEVKSRRSPTDDLTFEINMQDGKPVLVEKRVHYYLFLLPGRKPILIDYITFQQIFYNGLYKYGQIKKNRNDDGTVIFIPIDEFITAYEKFMGYV